METGTAKTEPSVVTVRCTLTDKPNMPRLINGLLAFLITCYEEQKTFHGNL